MVRQLCFILGIYFLIRFGYQWHGFFSSDSGQDLAANPPAPPLDTPPPGTPPRKDPPAPDAREGSAEACPDSAPKSGEASTSRVSSPSPSSSSSSSPSVSSSSYTSSSSSSAFLAPPSSPLFPNPASTLLKLLSSSVFPPSPLPYPSPLYAGLLPQPVLPDHAHALGALEIKRKLEADLEESLRLVRKMIYKGLPRGEGDSEVKSQPEAPVDVSSATKRQDALDDKALISSYERVFSLLEGKAFSSMENLAGEGVPRWPASDGALDLSKDFQRLNECLMDGGFGSRTKNKRSKDQGSQRKRLKGGSEGNERKRQKHTSKKNEYQSLSSTKSGTEKPAPGSAASDVRTGSTQQEASSTNKKDPRDSARHSRQKSKRSSGARRDHKHSSKHKASDAKVRLLEDTSQKKSRKDKQRWSKTKPPKPLEACRCCRDSTTSSDTSTPPQPREEERTRLHDTKPGLFILPKKCPKETPSISAVQAEENARSYAGKLLTNPAAKPQSAPTQLPHLRYDRNDSLQVCKEEDSSSMVEGERDQKPHLSGDGDSDRPSWRFHDLLSSDSDSDSEAGHLMIDTDN